MKSSILIFSAIVVVNFPIQLSMLEWCLFKVTVLYLFYCHFLGVRNLTLSHLIASTAYTQPILGIILRRGCNNKPGSKAVYDTCGVCGGDGTDCIGCDGIKNSGI